MGSQVFPTRGSSAQPRPKRSRHTLRHRRHREGKTICFVTRTAAMPPAGVIDKPDVLFSAMRMVRTSRRREDQADVFCLIAREVWEAQSGDTRKIPRGRQMLLDFVVFGIPILFGLLVLWLGVRRFMLLCPFAYSLRS